MRLAVYTDYPYHRIDGRIYAERAFAIFLAGLAPHFDRFTVIGRLAPDTDRGRYALGEQVELVPLPYYARLSEPLPVARALVGSVRSYWKALADIDCIWLLGPHPIAFLFAALAKLRGKQVILGVRQDFPEYVRNRHPHRRLLRASAIAFESAFQFLGRFCSVVVVGPKLTGDYRHSRRLLQLAVSLVDEADVVSPASRQRDYDGTLKVLSVGRLDREKNPLLLADVLAALNREDPNRWRLVVCGEGSMEDELSERLDELGVRDSAELRGYVAHEELKELYSECHMLLHVSWTEGLPQVLFEAFAAATPVVATDVGGIREATESAVSLIPPGDRDAAAEALRRLANDPHLREQLALAGHAIVASMTLQEETSRLAGFLSGGGQ
ncbi:MAG: glycosyltransferase [Solirubrobacterales bacterium]